MPRLSPLPIPNPTPRARQNASSDPAKLLGRMFDEPQRKTQRRLDDIKTRREFRLIQGGKP
jgi:hypothetical protein